jgi:predicted dehydrogenase
VEKPLTTNTEQAQILTALARHKSLKLFVGHVFLFNPAVQYIKKTLEAKVLGQLYYAYFRRTNLGPVRADVNALWDLAPHDVAILHYVMGENPDWITANGSSFINTPVHDVVFTHLRYKNGFAANLHVSWLDPRKVREVVIVGSEKMLVFDDTDLENPIKIYHKGIDSTYTELKVTDTIFQFRKSIFQGELSTPVIPAGEPLKAECQCFIDWVLRDIPHSNSDALSLSVVRTLELASESLVNLGKPMPFSSKDLSRDSEGMRPFAETPAQPVEVHLQ